MGFGSEASEVAFRRIGGGAASSSLSSSWSAEAFVCAAVLLFVLQNVKKLKMSVL